MTVQSDLKTALETYINSNFSGELAAVSAEQLNLERLLKILESVTPVTLSGDVTIDNVGITSSVLPTGAATEVTLDLIADTTALDGGTTPTRALLVGGKHDGIIRHLKVNNSGELTIAATGTQLAADSISITPASDAAFTLSAESGFLTLRDTALSNTAVAIKASAGAVMGWNFINVNTVPVYVKFYNTAAASVTVGTTPILLTIAVPAGSLNLVTPDLVPVEVFSTAISFACVTGLADNSTTAPSTAIHASVRYK